MTCNVTISAEQKAISECGDGITVREHTPGPWMVNEPHAARSISRQVLAEDGSCIAELPGWHRTPIDANARLIAAAPELLEALCAIALSRGTAADCATIARAAIAKVKGSK